MIRICLLVTLLLTPGAASAQTGADDIRALITKGQKVVITDTRGQQLTGRVTRMTDTAITIEHRRQAVQIPSSEIAMIDRPKDGLGDGALRGLAVGLAAGAIVGLSAPSRESQSPFCGMGFFDNCGDPDAAVPIIAGGAIGGLVGASIDALIRRDRQIYRRRATRIVTLPTFSVRGVGAQLTVSW